MVDYGGAAPHSAWLRDKPQRSGEFSTARSGENTSATDSLVLGQEAVPDKANELAAIPVLLARLAERDGLRGALVSIDAIATNGTIAQAIRDAGADYLLAVKANQPGLRAEVEACFTAAPPGSLDTHTEHDKGHGRVEQRTTSVVREVDWLAGERRFPGELRLPDAASIVRVEARIQRGEKTHAETRYYISSATLTAEAAGRAVRGHWGIENRLHWVLDVTFNDDQSRLRKGFGAKNMAVVRHFALNLVRAARIRNPSSSAAKSSAGHRITSTRPSNRRSDGLGFGTLLGYAPILPEI